MRNYFWKKKWSIICSAISLIILFHIVRYIGSAKILQTCGFGVGFLLFTLFFMFLLLSKTNFPQALLSILFIAIGFLGFSWLASIELSVDKNPAAVLLTSIETLKNEHPLAVLLTHEGTRAFINYFIGFSIIFGAFYYFLFLSICAFVGSIFSKGLEMTMMYSINSHWAAKWRLYLWGQGFTVFSAVLALFYAWTIIAMENEINKELCEELFERNFWLSPWIVLWQIGSWSLTLCLARKKINDTQLAEHIKTKNFPQFNAKKQVFIGFAILLATCTFFEAFRGLWLIWFGTAIWITLMFASLWKIWKHVFDVPETKGIERTP